MKPIVDSAVFALQTIQKIESPLNGSPVVRFYRARSSLFRFLRKRCRICHQPPNVLYYDSPQLGFLCHDCHTHAIEQRLASIRKGRAG